MAGVGLIGPVAGAWSRRGLLAILLVGALLLCHGAYGALHQMHQISCAAGLPAADHPSHDHGHGGGDAQHPGEASSEGCLGNVAYAATLLLISLGALLWPLNGGRAWVKVPASSPLMRPFPPLVRDEARGPPLPALLQVFRL
jgi:hypothetical protein